MKSVCADELISKTGVSIAGFFLDLIFSIFPYIAGLVYFFFWFENGVIFYRLKTFLVRLGVVSFGLTKNWFGLVWFDFSLIENFIGLVFYCFEKLLV